MWFVFNASCTPVSKLAIETLMVFLKTMHSHPLMCMMEMDNGKENS